jgi:hypothetical protein
MHIRVFYNLKIQNSQFQVHVVDFSCNLPWKVVQIIISQHGLALIEKTMGWYPKKCYYNSLLCLLALHIFWRMSKSLHSIIGLKGHMIIVHSSNSQ